MNRWVHPRILVVLAIVGATALDAQSSSSSADREAQASAAKRQTVKVLDNRFKTSKVTVAKNGVVTWRWNGANKHDVYFVSGPRKPRNCRIQRKGKCARRFKKRGKYSYLCTRHGSMTGRVSVK